MENSTYTDDILTDAKLAHGSYGGKDVKGFTIDKELSSPDRTAYVDPEGNLTMSFRGTDLKNKANAYRDIGTDLLVGLGLQDLSSRFKNAKKATDKAVEKYGRDKVTVTGHSLGGSQAIAVSRASGVKGTAFNAGIGLGDVVRKRTYGNITSYRTANDLVSGLSNKVRRLKTTVLKGSGHSLVNFLD